MSHELYLSPSGFPLALLADDRLSVSLGFEDSANCSSSQRKTQVTNAGSASGVVKNPGYTPCTERPLDAKVEEWQLVPDEFLRFITGNELMNTGSEDQRFFKNVASELRFCLEKIEEIKCCHGYNNNLKRCHSVEQPSRESSPVSWNSHKTLSLESDFFDLDLSQVHFRDSLFETPAEDKFLADNQSPDNSSEGFSDVTSTDCPLSSYEQVKSPDDQTDILRTEYSETHQPLRTQELLAPYRPTDDNKEAMLFSLVQDLSLESPCWDDSSRPNCSEQNGVPEFIDKQPQSIQSDLTLPSKASSQCTDTSGFITISYSDSLDSNESNPSPPISQVGESTENRFLHDDIWDFKHCLLETSAGDHNGASGKLLNKMDEKNHYDGKEVELDEIAFKDDWNGEDKSAKGDALRKENRQKKWWSSTEDKRDISLMKLPGVSAEGVVFHMNESGAVKVGEGSFGTVFLADLFTHGAVYKVVVKDFSPKAVTKPSEILEEARILLHLSDTMFVPFFYGVLPVASPQQYALVQEFFAEGLSLHNLIEDKSRRLSEISWISICVQMTVGLDRFHQKGILMNDIKKDNILVDCRSEECVVKYIDMGLASYKVGRVFFGSEDYMKQFSHLSPEVKRLERTSPASDVYSIGKILLSISRTAPLRAIKEAVSPCVSFQPGDRPPIREIICKLLTVRDAIYSGSAGEPSRPVSGRRWLC